MFFVPTAPGSGEHSTYNRSAVAFDATDFPTRHVRWLWRFDELTSTTLAAKVRMVVDGVPATDWVSYVHADVGGWLFEFDTTNGHHIASPEIQPGGPAASVPVLHKPFLVNDTGAPLPLDQQKPWTALIRIEQGAGRTPKQITYAGAVKPHAQKRKPRVIQPYSTDLHSTLALRSQLWVRRWTANDRAKMTRRFERSSTNDIIVVPEQKYPYGNAISLGEFKAGMQPPATICRDGPANWGTHGYICKMILRAGGKGVYVLESNGRLSYLSFKKTDLPPGVVAPLPHLTDEGWITTIKGWRVTPQMRKHRGGTDGWEYVGDLAGVQGVKDHEPWGVAVARRMPDGSISNRDGFDFWVTDTLGHGINFVDGWPMHPDVSSITGRPNIAMFPPAGYDPVRPNNGISVSHRWGGNIDRTPSEYFDQPWDCEVDTRREKLVWSNFQGNSICRANLDGTGKEFILRGPAMSDAMLGIPDRLFPSSRPLADLRALIRDGSLDDPLTTCIRPQSIVIDSQGRLIFFERYTYAVRRIDLVARTVTTICLIPAASLSLTSSSSSTQDGVLSISDGTTGPLDRIVLMCWAHSHYLIDPTLPPAQAFLGGFAFNSGAYEFRNGPFNLTDNPNYAWGIAQGDGIMLMAGNDSGSQFIEITKRLPTDSTPNETLFKAGHAAYHRIFTETHGAFGYGELGYPNVELMGSWDDATLQAYAIAHGMPASDLAAFTYWVRFSTTDYDYTVPPNDTTPPAAPASDLSLTTATFSEEIDMYTLTFSGTTGSDDDIAKLRVYVGGGAANEFPAEPGQQFTVSVQRAVKGDVLIEHSFVDGAGNESARHVQTVFVPDQEAPAMPGADLTLVSVVWA